MYRVRTVQISLQVTARDRDGSRVVYTGITGDQAMVESLELDPRTGELTITDNSHLDRETKDSECQCCLLLCQVIMCLIFFAAYVLQIEAQDENGNPGISQKARARLVITVEDVNDMPPLFKQRKYEGFMTSDLSRLRNNLQVEAVDLDKTGTINSDVR